MIRTGDRTVDKQIDELHAMGQGHVFRFWDKLDAAARQSLIAEVMEIDCALMARLIAGLVPGATAPPPAPVIEPCPIIDRENDPQRAEAERAGIAAIRASKVAAFLVAGGQGTRLGYDGPKGAFVIGPLNGRTLFQIHAEKIRAAGRRYGVIIPWYIMTSNLNHHATLAFFKDHGHFGIDPANISFFEQSMIPAVDTHGRLILAARGALFRNPNGHGGSLAALHTSGALADMRRRGIEYISYFQVDNCLVRIVDPVFIGFHILEQAEMSSKVVDKRDPEEKVGVIGKVNGRMGVIEYSDLPREQKNARNDDGSLKYAAGSIAIHILSRTFVEEENKGGLRLPYHKAVKKIPFIDASGALAKPEKENGVKFETFVFDALADTKRSVTLRTRREDDFAPVKNAAGLDSPATARTAMDAQAKRWLAAAGWTGPLPGTVELSPLWADSAEEVRARLDGMRYQG
ncbi:MAG: UDPGP type 1 family protein [Planctomycetota bacterium]